MYELCCLKILLLDLQMNCNTIFYLISSFQNDTFMNIEHVYTSVLNMAATDTLSTVRTKKGDLV